MTNTEKAAKIVHDLSEGSVEVDQINAETNLEAIGLDSLDMVELVMSVEDAFEIEIDDAAATQIKTFGDLTTLVDRLVAAKPLA